MRSSRLRIVALLVALPAWCAAGQDKPLPLDPTIFDRSLARQEKTLPWQGVTKKTESTAKYFLPTGYSWAARQENSIFSYNTETPAIAVVERDVEFLKKVVLPAGTRVIGTVSVQQSHDRVLITFHALVFPDGEEVKFLGMALMLDGSAGIKGKVQTFKDAAVANTVLRSLVTGTQSAISMTAGISPIAAGAAQGLSNEATSSLDTHRQQQVTTSISVDADTPLRVYLPQRIEY